MEIQELLMKALTNYDQNRPRSQQVEIGVSAIGGCRKQVWLHLQNTPKTNSTMRLPGLMGTAIHKMIEEAFSEFGWGEYEQEIEVEWDGLKGHIDLYIPSEGAVVDWKTTKKAALAKFPSQQQRWQVQLYGYLLEMNGRKIETVSLVGIPRDADERSIVVHTEPYNREIVVEALTWLDDIRERESAPPPETFKAICNLYCAFYGSACAGL